ncbi:olfactory receptor 8S1-like [Cebus imitator]|uniref:olfactory receptor 8S1-like n=1 Tax=Cebus imitator TaxID=2715852 RepID=UPI000809C10E|nr:olfactory receptor 8S1-like [Cebus imitator]
MALGNHSTITEFLLLGLSADPHVQALLFVLLLGIYLLTVIGNLTLLLVTRADSRLHTPMYFFLSHLAFVDLCLSSTIVPKMLENLLSQRKAISVEGCLAQVFFVFVTAGTEACLLSGMAYDRYTAVCCPLLYGQIMGKQLCMHLVWGSWGLGFLDALINVLLAVNMVFCEAKIIHHYSCEMPSLLSLSCSDISRNLIALLCSTLLHGLGTFLLVFLSYTRIISTILSISSASGRSKAFSTCSAHLTAVTLYYASGLLRHLMPNSGSPMELIFSVQYTVVTPMLNPLIYSLKNKEVKLAATFAGTVHGAAASSLDWIKGRTCHIYSGDSRRRSPTGRQRDSCGRQGSFASASASRFLVQSKWDWVPFWLTFEAPGRQNRLFS